MKQQQLVVTLALAACTVLLGACSMLGHRGHHKAETFSCDNLVALGEQYAGSIIYYTKGHYDAKRDVWTDYGPNAKTATIDEVDNYYLPVEDIYNDCVANPKQTLMQAIWKHDHSAMGKHGVGK